MTVSRRPPLRLWLVLVAFAASAGALAAQGRAGAPAPAATRVPEPKDVFGFAPGDDYKLASHEQIVEYFRALDAASDRIAVEEIGKSSEGRPMILAAISSEANIKNRARYQEIARQLAHARGVDEPKSIVITVNAGAVPAEHWTNDREAGGGRIIGEACHFIDLLRFLVGHPIEAYQVSSLRRGGTVVEDNAAINLTFADGSVGTVGYFSNGSKAFAKERIEVFCAGRVLQNNGFIELRGYGNSVENALAGASVVDGSTILNLGFDHTVTLTSPRCAFLSREMKVRDCPIPPPMLSGISSSRMAR